MTLLRQRMLQDLRLRGLAVRTQDTYIRQVALFARHFGRSPAKLGPEEIRTYLVYLVEERRLSGSSVNQATAALRFLYTVTLQRRWDLGVVAPYSRLPKKLPVVLSREEVARLIDSARGLRDRALVMTAYSTGARNSELRRLQISDIDGERQVIRIRSGKGAKDRNLPLVPSLLEALRAHYRFARPIRWLFPGARPDSPLSVDGVRRVVRLACERATLKKRVTPHTLRHTCATHWLEAGIDLLTIRRLLGHKSLDTVQIYTHLSRNSLGASRLGIDLLSPLAGRIAGSPEEETL